MKKNVLIISLTALFVGISSIVFVYAKPTSDDYFPSYDVVPSWHTNKNSVSHTALLYLKDDCKTKGPEAFIYTNQKNSGERIGFSLKPSQMAAGTKVNGFGAYICAGWMRSAQTNAKLGVSVTITNLVGGASFTTPTKWYDLSKSPSAVFGEIPFSTFEWTGYSLASTPNSEAIVTYVYQNNNLTTNFYAIADTVLSVIHDDGKNAK